MTELSFAKSFLSTLDARPTKLQPDHITNPKTLELHFPYTLPRMPHPMTKPSATAKSTSSDPKSSQAPATPANIAVLLKSSRNPPLELRLNDIDAGTTSVLELKERVAKELALDGTGTIKVLWERKPVSDAKTVKEVVGEVGLGKGEVEFGVMVMGYVAPAVSTESAETKGAAEGDKMDIDVEGVGGGTKKGADADGTVGEEFWSDLKGFLQQRLKNEGVAGEAFECFQKAWKGR